MDNLIQDLRYGIRMFLRKPGLTAIAVLALALGTGANTALFSVINAVLLRPLPYKAPDQLIQLAGVKADKPQEMLPTSPPNFKDWRDQNNAFSQMAAHTPWAFNLTGAGEPERLKASMVTSELFPLLGVGPAMGRGILPEDEQPGASRVVILSHSLWQQRFGSDAGLIGQTISLDGESYTVAGVMPPDFQFPASDINIWVPLALNFDPTRRLSFYLDVVARLKPGITIDEARAEMSGIASRLEQQYPATNTGWGIKVVSMHEQIVGDVRPMLLVLFGAVGFVLLIACANVANLLLAQGVARRKEIAIRSALGAGRLRVMRQLLTESFLLSAIGGGLGLLIAMWGIDALTGLNPDYIPRAQDISIDGRVLSFTLAISLLTGVIFGLAPALQASRSRLNEALKDGSKGAEGGSRQRLRGALVVSEVALALVLLIGAGLLLKSFLSLQRVSMGFDPENVVVMDLSIPVTKYEGPPQWSGFYQQVLERAQAVPGVESVALTNTPPLSGYDAKLLFNIEGRPPKSQQEYTAAYYRVVSPGYFRAMKIPLLEGRNLSERDQGDAPVAVVINREMARRFFPGEDPIGKRLKLGINPASNSPWMTVAGIVGDVKSLGLKEAAEPEMHVSHLQLAQPFMSLAVRADKDPMNLVAAIKQVVQEVDKDQPVANIATMENVISDSIADRRFTVLLLEIFAGLSLLLAAVGLYGVMSHAVTQRTREIGIRMALGAQPGNVLRMVARQGLTLSLIGVGIGLGASVALTRFLSSLLYEVSATDPATFLIISLMLASVALAACYIPARRAARVDPMEALRYE